MNPSELDQEFSKEGLFVKPERGTEKRATEAPHLEHHQDSKEQTLHHSWQEVSKEQETSPDPSCELP